MAIDTADATTGIDPSTVELPDALGERFQRAFDLDRQPTSYGGWARAIAETFEAERDRSISTDDLCDTEASPHTATLDGETTHYVCVQDPIVVGLLADDPVTVESTPPTSDETVTIEFDGDGVTAVEPEGSLLSFGIAADVQAPPEITPEAMYGLVCPYGHAFPDDASYDEWAGETDAVTDVLSVSAGVSAMAALVEAAGMEGFK
ncbi:alkylmercury lyase [Salinarchaeum sp. Harcht-Bsk1]|uniref:alkylmercury lyase n=1 Tax=Salinarchaeum sp. Harcht-Bsk1 TaxID=1333523 RepID=UPI00034230D4|nr:alkylmercury lyase [Salinarchaeum sp. Harcht-Bsk1]AGN02405.1 alkylmercury lyase [Salinarchaeum sp. Harcht-Bsk1]